MEAHEHLAKSKKWHKIPHLCPLIRRFCKNIPVVSISLPFLCRDILLGPHRSRIAQEVIVRNSKISDTRLTWPERSELKRRFDERCPRASHGHWAPVGRHFARAYVASTNTCRGEESLETLAMYAESNYKNVEWVLGGEWCLGATKPSFSELT
jgi:hypothetical protein